MEKPVPITEKRWLKIYVHFVPLKLMNVTSSNMINTGIFQMISKKKQQFEKKHSVYIFEILLNS